MTGDTYPPKAAPLQTTHAFCHRPSFSFAGQCNRTIPCLGFDMDCWPAHGVSTILRQRSLCLPSKHISLAVASPTIGGILFSKKSIFLPNCFVNSSPAKRWPVSCLVSGTAPPVPGIPRAARALKKDSPASCPHHSCSAAYAGPLSPRLQQSSPCPPRVPAQR